MTEQHDDHIWLTVDGEAWAIQSIDHHPLVFHLWRGYEPHLEFMTVIVRRPNFAAYCEAVAALLA